MSTPDRNVPAWALPAGLTTLVLALVAIALLRGPVSLEPDSPEGTVQEYLVAIREERWDDAIEILHDDWRGGCEGADIEMFSPGDFSAELGGSGGSDGRMTRETFVAIPSDDGDAPPTTVPESATEVDVTIRHDDGGLGSGWNEGVTFELIEDDGFWWLTGDPWPYFAWNCRSQ